MVEIKQSENHIGYPEGWAPFHENGFIIYRKKSETQLEIRSVMKDGGYLQINDCDMNIDECLSGIKIFFDDKENWFPEASFNDIDCDIDYMLCRQKSHEGKWVATDSFDALLKVQRIYKECSSVWFWIMGEKDVELIEKDFDLFLKNAKKNTNIICMSAKTHDDYRYHAIFVFNE